MARRCRKGIAGIRLALRRSLGVHYQRLGLIPQALSTSSRDTLNSSTSAAVGSGPSALRVSGSTSCRRQPPTAPIASVSSSATLPAMFFRSWRSLGQRSGHCRQRESPSRWPRGPLDSSASAAMVSAARRPVSWAACNAVQCRARAFRVKSRRSNAQRQLPAYRQT